MTGAPGRRRAASRGAWGAGRVVAVIGVVVALLVGIPVVVVLSERVTVERTPPVSAAPAAPAPSSSVPPSSPAPVSPSRAEQAVEAADASVTRSGADVGVAVLDLATGTVAGNDEAGSAMNAASVAKLLTAVDVLTRGAEGAATVTDADRRLVSRALGPSDDPAMNALWSRFGGEAGIERVIDRLQLADTTVPDDPSQWGEVQLSARDTTTVLRFVVEGLAPADRDLVLDAMSSAPAQAADGFDQAFGLLDPARRGPAAAKQGWLCCLQQSVDLHSAGFLDGDDPVRGRYVLAILSNQPFGYPAARGVLDDAAAAARDTLRG